MLAANLIIDKQLRVRKAGAFSQSIKVQGLRLQLTEQAFESTSSQQGTITLELPGLPEGVNVTRACETFFVNEGTTLLERNEVRVWSFPIRFASYEPFLSAKFYSPLVLLNILCTIGICRPGFRESFLIRRVFGTFKLGPCTGETWRSGRL